MSAAEAYLKSVREFKEANTALPDSFFPITSLVEQFKNHPSQSLSWRTESRAKQAASLPLKIPPALPKPSDLTAAVMRWEAAHNAMIKAWDAVPVKERAGLLQPTSV